MCAVLIWILEMLALGKRKKRASTFLPKEELYSKIIDFWGLRKGDCHKNDMAQHFLSLARKTLA